MLGLPFARCLGGRHLADSKRIELTLTLEAAHLTREVAYTRSGAVPEGAPTAGPRARRDL